MVRFGPILLVLLLSACSATGNSDPSEGETTKTERPRDLRVERIAAGAPGQGPRNPRVVVAPSAAVLSAELGAEIPDSGEGTYLVAQWGERPTGGYSIGVAGARIEGERVTVRFSLKEPPSDAIVTQALTYPYVISVVKDLDPAGKKFSFVDRKGEKLDWPVRRAGE